MKIRNNVFLLAITSLIAFYYLFLKVEVDELSPLESTVKKHKISDDEVVYLYMYGKTDGYKIVVEENLRLCSEGKIKKLAFSTFDKETESIFLSLLRDKYSPCYLIFYGTESAVEIVKESVDAGVFVIGDLESNSEVKRLYE